ncbi:MAG: PD40 domain-containing protein [Acidimicrobiales bacterium]|nr:PD40 domain-containing protein [Acidimicrobiales bacterium]
MSSDATGTETGDRASHSPVFSPDGTKVAFLSMASDLVATDTNGKMDIFLRDLSTGVTTLLSTNAAGSDSANDWSSDPVFSPDGTKVAFRSAATDLGPPDTNTTVDIYVRDLATGATDLVSADENGSAGGSTRGRPVFGPDGRRVAFASSAALVRQYEWSYDGRFFTDVFVRDLDAGTTTLVSIDANGTKTGDNGSFAPTFSPDGDRIAFVSRASDLGPVDTNGYDDLYVRDLQTGTTSLVTSDVEGADAGDRWTGGPGLFSPDGQTLYFTSNATNLVDTPDANGFGTDVFARDLVDATTALVSYNAAGTASANGGSSLSALSTDGTKLAFESAATDLGPPDTNTFTDIYVRDLATGAVEMVTASADGADGANSRSHSPSFSPDGTSVAFASHATNLGPSDSDGAEFSSEALGVDADNLDVFVRDLVSDTTTMVSTNEAGSDSGNGNALGPVFSSDGKRLAYSTTSTDLGYADHNYHEIDGGLADVYIAELHGADLAVTLDADRASVADGDTIRLDLRLTNEGPDPALDTAVAVVLPEHVELVDVESTGATCTSPEPTRPDVLVCDVGTLAVSGGAAATIRLAAGGEPATTLSTVAIAASSTLDPDRTDNAASVDVIVE